jgi:ribonuclease R
MSTYQINTLKGDLVDIVRSSSEGEVLAVELERAVNNMKFAEYMEQEVGKEFIGNISTITNFGMFVELENTIEGLLPFGNIRANEYFEFDPEHGTLRSRNSSLGFRLGEKIKISVKFASKAQRKVEFAFVSKDILNK